MATQQDVSFTFIDDEEEISPSIQGPQDTSFTFVEEEPEESSLKSFARLLYQLPSGIAQKFTFPADIIQMMGMGEALDPEEIEHLRKIHEREGIPFDEEKYLGAVQTAAETFPTQSNIERMVEEKTGAPLTPQTAAQKMLKLGSTAAGFTPGTAAQKLAAGVSAPVTAEALKAAGLPEPLAEIGGLMVSGGVAKTAPAKISKEVVKKPSGLPVRKFEKLKEPRKIAPKKHLEITENLEKDFKSISDKIAEKSPISKVKTELKENPTFKAEVGEEFQKVKELSEELPKKVEGNALKKGLLTRSNALEKKGISPSEYEKEFKKYLKGHARDVSPKEASASDLVDQYRKNNSSLSEAFDPGRSRSFNRAKKDALIEYNKEIAETFEKQYPNTEFSKLFKETNEKWAKIADVESMDNYIEEIFSDKKINFKKAKRIFDKENYARPFKRALGDEGYRSFQELIKDFVGNEKSLRMIKAANETGFSDLAGTVTSFMVHPKLGMLKYGVSKGKRLYNTLINASLDNPEYIIKFEKGMKDFSKRKFKEAAKKISFVEKKLQEKED